jgi:hypothetical protein
VTRGRRIRIAALVALVALLVAGGFSFQRKKTSELPVYLLGAERMVAGEEIYRLDEPKPFTYPPFFALAFVPMSALPDALQRPFWYVVQLLLLGASLRIAALFLSNHSPDFAALDRRRRIWCWVLVFLISARFVMAVFSNQSHDLIILLLVAASAFDSARGRDLRAGIWAGLAAACKATPLLFLPIFLLQRRWRASAGLTVALLAASLLPDVVLPRAEGGSWALAWKERVVQRVDPSGSADVGSAFSRWNPLNQNLPGTLYRVTTPGENAPKGFEYVEVAPFAVPKGLQRGLILGLQALVLALLAWACLPRRFGETNDDWRGWRRFGEAGAVACAMLLLSPMSSKSHFCVLLVPALFLAPAVVRPGRDKLTALLVAGDVVLSGLPSRGLVGRWLTNRLLAAGTIAWGTLLLLAATARLLTRPNPLAARNLGGGPAANSSVSANR